MALVLHKPYPVADRSSLVDVPFLRPGKPSALARLEAAQAFQRMFDGARLDRVSLVILSAFRTWEEQDACFRDAQRRHGKRRAALWVAPPGHSEHHTGFVFDIGDKGAPEVDDDPLFERTEAFRWLKKNASRYGFELSFPPGNPGRVSYEPWHWRYVGNREAWELFHPRGLKNLTLWVQALSFSIREYL